MNRILTRRYILKNEFLKGRFSTLYFAEDKKTSTSLVIRKMHTGSLVGEKVLPKDVRLQILREGRILSKLSHRNIPKVLDVIEDGDEIYLILEDFKGNTLREFVEDSIDFIDERLIRRWASQLINVLAYLHSQSPPIILRDLRPEIVVITPHGVLKIAEFGIAKLSEGEKTDKTLFRTIGDKRYASPEQLLNQPSSFANDIYSLGALLYFISTKKDPDPSLARFYNKEKGKGIRDINPKISREFSTFINKLMEPNAESRPQKMEEVIELWMELMPEGASFSISIPGIFKKKEEKADSKKAKKSLWENFFSLPEWFGGERESRIKAAPEKMKPSEGELEKYPFIDLSSMQIDREVGKVLPEAISRSIQGVCIGRPSSREITVAVKDPTQVYIYDHISYATQGAYKPVLVRADSVMIDLAREFIYHPAAASQGKTWLEWLEQKKYEADKLDVKSTSEELEIFKEEIKGPVIEAVDKIIKEAISIGASDIHLETYENEMLVRYRIDGILHLMNTFTRKMGSAIVKRIKLTAGMDIAQERITQGGRISVRVRDKEFDLRVSIVPVRYGENVVMRLLNKGAFNFTLSGLGFSQEAERKYRKLLEEPHGMILVSGPTGSGKSTTLYASLTEINRPDRKLLTVEDPIEYEMPGVTQVQVNLAPKEEEKRVTFAKALREFLRQDPDVILVGEIRDEETAAISVQAALTGHLLLSTIHTNDSVGIITRLEDMGVEPYLVASTLVGGIAQRLVRKVCPHCKEEVLPSEDLLDAFAREGIHKYSVFKGKGCLQCHRTGTKGRLGLYEVLVITPQIRKLIVSKANTDKILKVAQEEGMKTIYQDGISKVAQGFVPYEEVLRVSMGGH